MSEGIVWFESGKIILSFLIVCCFVWLIGQKKKRQRAQRLQRAIQDSTRGQFLARRGPDAAGFAGTIVPAPEPFRYLEIIFYAHTILDPLDLLFSMFGRSRNVLVWRGQLVDRPRAEVVWQQGCHASVVLGKQPGDTLWTYSGLDFANIHFAVRGANVQPLKHAFVELVTRFGRHVQRLCVQRDREPEVEFIVHARALDSDEIPRMLTALCALCRATGRG